MISNWMVSLFCVILTIYIGFIGCTTNKPVETIFWEEDTEGFIQFYTNDSGYYNYYFFTWNDEYYRSEMGEIETKVKKVSGCEWGGYGIVFCLQDENNFYLLLIDTMGYYAVYEQFDSNWVEHRAWTYSDSLKTGFNKINTLKVEHQNFTNRFKVNVNGSYIASFYDESFNGGYSGYFVEVWDNDYESFPNTPVDVRFKQIQDENLFDDITFEEIQSASLSSDKIDGSIGSNKLTEGTIVLYKTDQGRYGIFRVEEYGYALTIKSTTYSSDGSVYSSGYITIRGTWHCDLDVGVETKDVFSTADFWWEQVTSTERYLTPQHGALFAVYQ